MKDYNMMSETGMTDMEFAEAFGMPEHLVGTPEMNNWMIDKVYTDNVEAESKTRIDSGMEPGQAVKEATAFAENSRRAARANLKKVSKIRGY